MINSEASSEGHHITPPLSELRRDSLVRDKPEQAVKYLGVALNSIVGSQEKGKEEVINCTRDLGGGISVVLENVILRFGGWGLAGGGDENGKIEVHTSDGEDTHVLSITSNKTSTPDFAYDGREIPLRRSELFAQRIFDAAVAVEEYSKQPKDTKDTDIDKIAKEVSDGASDLGVV
ncbi:hypothetical protein KKF55_02975 [Patescibacteria group bacterium]|nr:hypothetical protein [Patescibacteria group bacterium]